MLYTSYLSRISKISEKIPKLIITRYPPRGMCFDNDKHKTERKVCLAKELSPKSEILNSYKRHGDWDDYVSKFNTQMEEYLPTRNYLDSLERYLKEDNDLVLVCYEKDYKKCHRYLIAQYLVDKGIEWKEF